MNDQQLTQVIDNVAEGLVHAPGDGQQLIPAAQTMQAAPDAIVNSATQLAANIIQLYQRRVNEAEAKLAEAREIAEKLIATSAKVAGEVKALDVRDGNIDNGIQEVLRANGVLHEGKV